MESESNRETYTESEIELEARINKLGSAEFVEQYQDQAQDRIQNASQLQQQSQTQNLHLESPAKEIPETTNQETKSIDLQLQHRGMNADLQTELQKSKRAEQEVLDLKIHALKQKSDDIRGGTPLNEPSMTMIADLVVEAIPDSNCTTIPDSEWWCIEGLNYNTDTEVGASATVKGGASSASIPHLVTTATTTEDFRLKGIGVHRRSPIAARPPTLMAVVFPWDRKREKRTDSLRLTVESGAVAMMFPVEEKATTGARLARADIGTQRGDDLTLWLATTQRKLLVKRLLDDVQEEGDALMFGLGEAKDMPEVVGRVPLRYGGIAVPLGCSLKKKKLLQAKTYRWIRVILGLVPLSPINANWEQKFWNHAQNNIFGRIINF